MICLPKNIAGGQIVALGAGVLSLDSPRGQVSDEARRPILSCAPQPPLKAAADLGHACAPSARRPRRLLGDANGAMDAHGPRFLNGVSTVTSMHQPVEDWDRRRPRMYQDRHLSACPEAKMALLSDSFDAPSTSGAFPRTAVRDARTLRRLLARMRRFGACCVLLTAPGLPGENLHAASARRGGGKRKPGCYLDMPPVFAYNGKP